MEDLDSGRLPDSGRTPQDEYVTCDICGKSMLSNHRQRHLQIHNKPCRLCNKLKNSLQKRNKHERKCRQKIRSANFQADFKSSHDCERAINGRFMTFAFAPINDSVDYEENIAQNQEIIKRTLQQLQHHYSAIKFYTKYEVLFRKDIEGSAKEFGFYSKTISILQSSNIDDLMTECKLKTAASIDKFVSHGSGWIFEEFTSISLHVTQYRPCAGGSYLPLPPQLRNKKSLRNIKNTDDRCIIYCLAAALYPHKNDNMTHPSTYKETTKKIKCDDVSFPTPLREVPKLEKLNEIRINVYGFDFDPDQPKDDALNTGIFPTYVSPFNYEKTVNLLLIAHENTHHYILITSLDALLKDKTKYGKTKHCERCLQGFWKKDQLERHMEMCKDFKVQRTQMPNDTHIEFKNVRKQLQFPVAIIGDFESILKPHPQRINDNRKTKIINEHIACGYSYKVVSDLIPELTSPAKVVREEGCVKTFISDIYEEYENLKYLFEEPVDIIMTPEDNEIFKNTTICHICENDLDWGNKTNKVVRDHCHFTGWFFMLSIICFLPSMCPSVPPINMHGLLGNPPVPIVAPNYQS